MKESAKSYQAGQLHCATTARGLTCAFGEVTQMYAVTTTTGTHPVLKEGWIEVLVKSVLKLHI